MSHHSHRLHLSSPLFTSPGTNLVRSQWEMTQILSSSFKTKLSSSSPSPKRIKQNRGLQVKAFFFNPIEDPLVKEALKEPVAFMGGMFAGLLRLDLNEEPLKEWVTRTVEASDITIEEKGLNSEEEEAPQQIEIE